jgi:hypothetical protein
MGRPGLAVGEVLDDVGDLVQVTDPAQAGCGETAQPEGGRLPHPRHRGQAHRDLETRQRDHPDRRGDLAADAARCNEDQPLGALGELVGELHRHTATEAVADHGDLVDAQHGEQVAHPVGVAADAVVGPWLVGAAVPEQVRGDHGVAA